MHHVFLPSHVHSGEYISIETVEKPLLFYCCTEFCLLNNVLITILNHHILIVIQHCFIRFGILPT